MKSLALKLGFLYTLFISVKSFACGIDWQVPQNHFDGVNEWGQLSYWRKIGAVDFGDGLKIPLIIGFNPTRGVSPYLGKGWMVPLLESNIVQVDEKKFLLTQPDGIVRQFWRKKPTDTVLQGQGNWRGEIKDNLITLWAECGWKLAFKNGKIVSIATPNNRILNMMYGNNQIVGVQEKGNTILKVDIDSGSGDIKGFSYNGTHIGIAVGDEPRVETIQGKNIIGGMDRSLNKLTLPDGKQIIYAFAIDENIRPKLRITDEISRNFIWDASTGHIVVDGDWTYNIAPGSNRFANAKIERTDSDQRSESWFDDKETGVETIRELSGDETVKRRFVSGPLAGFSREIVTKEPNGSIESIFRPAYDEKGNLVRLTTGSECLQWDYVKNGDSLVSKSDGSTKELLSSEEHLRAIAKISEAEVWTYCIDQNGEIEKLFKGSELVSSQFIGKDKSRSFTRYASNQQTQTYIPHKLNDQAIAINITSKNAQNTNITYTMVNPSTMKTTIIADGKQVPIPNNLILQP